MPVALKNGLHGRLGQLHTSRAAILLLSSRAATTRPGRFAHTALLSKEHGNVSQKEHETATTPISEQCLIYPDPPRSVKHHDLPSFLRHAEHARLDPKTTTYVGTHYEYTVAIHLASLGFELRRVGGASDRGIDLIGVWSIPSDAWRACHAPIRVLLQCKAGAGQRVGPHLVRELEGAFVGAPAGWRPQPGNDAPGSAVVGLLVTERPATKGIRDALTRSRWPMAFLCCSNTGHLRQMLWNQPAEQQCSLSGLGVTLSYSGKGGEEPHIVFTWDGRPLPPSRPQQLN